MHHHTPSTQGRSADDALDEYRQKKEAERDRARRKREEQRLKKEAQQERHREERERRSAERESDLEQLERLCADRNPAERYLGGAVRSIETDPKAQAALLDHVRTTGETDITVLERLLLPGMWCHHHINPYAFIDYDEFRAMIHQVHKRDVVRRRKIQEGPFAGWTFECRLGWFFPHFHLVDRRGFLGGIVEFLF